MGIDLGMYRARIGLFNNYRCTAINHQFSLLRYLYILVSLLIIMSLLLLSGDIHLNPGPLIDNCISFWYGNVRGLNSPSKLRSLFNNNYDILALTETFSMQIHQKYNMLIIYLFFVATDQEDLAAVLQFSSQTLWFQFVNLNLSSPTWRCCGSKLYFELSCWLAFATDHLTRVPRFGRIFNTPLTWRDRF